MRDRVVVVGNCQATAIEMLLATNPSFVEGFELVTFPPVHEIPLELVPQLHDAVMDAAVVVPQRVDEGYREGVGLGTETIARLASGEVVRWPSVYWAGYFPNLLYLRNEKGQPVVDGPFDYHDRTVLRAYADGHDVDETLRVLADPERPSIAAEWADRATVELEVRGRECDVDVAPFIESRFREKLLFFTMNHPANDLVAFIAQRVTELAGIPGQVDPERLPGELLGSTFYPLHACDARALELSFATEVQAGACPFRIRGVERTPAQAVASFFEYYAARPELVELNLD